MSFSGVQEKERVSSQYYFSSFYEGSPSLSSGLTALLLLDGCAWCLQRGAGVVQQRGAAARLAPAACGAARANQRAGTEGQCLEREGQHGVSDAAGESLKIF